MPKLELTWIGKDKRPKLEPRILLEDAEHSHHASARVSKEDIFDNMLIHGDNLLALKALEQDYAGKVKCIYIDPPYNTGSAFEHYDDGIEHSLWLTLMRDRLEILWSLLSEDGSIWINIDYNEVHYLKVLCDECFGRRLFLHEIIWQKRLSRENRKAIGSAHDTILLYSKKESTEWKQVRNLLAPNLGSLSNPDNDPRGAWSSTPFSAQGYRKNQMYEIKTPTGIIHSPPKGRCWGATEPVFLELLKDQRVYFPKNGDGRPRIKQFEFEANGLVPMSVWIGNDVGTTEESKKEINTLFGAENAFATPKPERLIQRILHIATNPGDLVLDSFLGSGTTAAVAHKMGRRWIGIELGDHCYTHCVPRLKKVIDGDDPGGITEKVGWKGGGGFRFYELGPSLITEDQWGNPVINPKFDALMLARALCKVEGFRYEPDEEHYWMQGRSTETDYLYVTTQFLTAALAEKISEDVGPGRTLLICCSAYDCDPKAFSNLTIKKIPRAVLDKCEWNHDDYSLEVAHLPEATPPVGSQLDLLGDED